MEEACQPEVSEKRRGKERNPFFLRSVCVLVPLFFFFQSVIYECMYVYVYLVPDLTQGVVVEVLLHYLYLLLRHHHQPPPLYQ